MELQAGQVETLLVRMREITMLIAEAEEAEVEVEREVPADSLLS